METEGVLKTWMSQGGKGMSQVSGQWRVGDELQRWGGEVQEQIPGPQRN